MSFVGTRPEATKYVEKYSNEMLASNDECILFNCYCLYQFVL